MSQIDAYNEQKRITSSVVEHLRKALGRDSPSNDKHHLRLQYTGKHSESWSDAMCTLHASYGYYGRSSGYCAMDKYVAQYLVAAINKAMPQLADHAMALAKADLENAKEAAKSEAKEIIGTLKQDEKVV